MDYLPFQIIRQHIICYLTNSEDLLNLQQVSKTFASYVKTHSYQNLRCYNCKSNRFTIHSNKNMCHIVGCMSSDLVHPCVKYWTIDNYPLCSMGCAIRYWKDNRR